MNTDPALRGWALHTDSRVIGLPKPNVSVKAVLAELATLQARLAAIRPDDMKDWPSADSRPAKEEIVGDIGPSLLALAGAGVLVWILVCINVANLALVRASDRRRELAVRFALGASRARVVREIAGAMIVLSLIAGALGIGLSYVIVRLIRNVAPSGLPRLGELALDGRLLVVRTSKDPAAMIPTLQRVLHAEEPGIPLAAGADGPVIRTMTSYQSESIASRDYLTWLVSAFAAPALIIALIGVYGLTAHTVTRRTAEIGVRVALGARPVDVVWLIIGQGLRLSIVGAVVGVAGALALGRLMSNLLYQTSPTDLWSFALATSTLIAAVVLATTIPARRATQLDPAMAMRVE